MRYVVNAVITDNEGKVLVVDKNKLNGTVLTILPGGKIDEGENDLTALERELKEELGITISIISKKIGNITGKSDTSSIHTNVILYKVYLPGNTNFVTNAEVTNPRFLKPTDILKLKTTTELTKDCINSLLK